MMVPSLIITFLFPMFSGLYNFGCLFFYKKHKVFFSIMTALSLALTAFIWNPETNFDLYRHHSEMIRYANLDLNSFISGLGILNEPLHNILKYILVRTGDLNILQLLIVFLGYFEIFYILSDYAKTKGTKPIAVLFTSIIILLSLKYIDFASGLFFYLSVINFAFGYYLEKYKNKDKLCWLFYLTSPLFHIGSAYILLIYLLAKFVKIELKTLTIVVVIVSLLIGPVIVWFYNNISIEFTRVIYGFYNSYILNGANYDNLHSGTILLFAFARLVYCLFIIYIYNKNFKNSYNNTRFELLIILSIIAILPSANIYLRYAIFTQLITAPMLMNILNLKRNNSKILIYLLSTLILSYGLYSQIISIQSSNIITDINKNAAHNILELENDSKGSL